MTQEALHLSARDLAVDHPGDIDTGVAHHVAPQVDDDVRLLTENQSVYIPLGAVHRLENPGKLPMVLIEVQTGAYLREDDIIRYQDDYARTT